MGDFRADLAAHLHNQKVVGGPSARSRHLQATRAFRARCHIGHGADTGTGIGDPNCRVAYHQRDMGKILYRVIAHLAAINRRADRMARDIGHYKRVAIGRGAGDGFTAKRGAGAGAVFHYDGNTQLFLQTRGNQARNQIRCAAGRERHHQSDGLGRPSPLRMRAHRQKRRRANTQYNAAACNAPHPLAPLFAEIILHGSEASASEGRASLASGDARADHRGNPKPEQEMPHAAW